MRKPLAGLLLAGLAAGCATLAPNETTLRPLLRALTEPVDQLARSAGTNQAEAELAYAILAEHRLRGVRSSALNAFLLRAAATSRTRTRSSTIYVPGPNGKAGTVINVPTTTYDLPPNQASLIARCVAALDGDLPETQGAAACGGPVLHARLRTLWAEAKIDPRTTPEALAALTCDPAAVRPVREAAGEAYNDEDQADRAIMLTDRIIAVCGESGPGWPARAMRADLAIRRNQPAEAIRLLAPLPRAGLGALGPAPSWFAMNAHGMLGDWTGYARERDTLMAASERALAASGRERERFRSGGWRIADYDVDAAGGLDRRVRRIFLATPDSPRTAPRAIHLIQGPSDFAGFAAMLELKTLGWELVQYQCYGTVTLKRFEGEAPPDPAEVRRLALESLALPDKPAPEGPEWTPGACGFPRQIAPGLGG